MATTGHLDLWVKISPNSKRNQIVGFEKEYLKIKIAAPPVEGKANIELIEFLSEQLDKPKSQITIVQGQQGKLKRIRIENLSLAQLNEILERALPCFFAFF